ncbi:hypothetical protein [Bacillus manliponensis]|uniref:hypothetical protein n=1 Tax=Bacillus manliponensis TaxID=574376 RepID=UPI0035147250
MTKKQQSTFKQLKIGAWCFGFLSVTYGIDFSGTLISNNTFSWMKCLITIGFIITFSSYIYQLKTKNYKTI